MRDPLRKRREMIQGKRKKESAEEKQNKKSADKQYIGLVTEEQFEFMRKLTFRFRSPKVNKSSMLRAMIQLLREVEFDYQKVKSQNDFFQAVKGGIKLSSS